MLESLVPEQFRKNLNRKYTPSSLGKKEKKETSQSGNVNKPFAAALEEKAKDNFEQDIDSFLEEIEGLEKTLMESPSRESVDQYRKSISGFLKKVSKNYSAFEFYTRKRMRCKIWKVMDQKLEDLYKGVISKQLKGLLLLDKLHEIKGLIVDLKVGGE